MLTKQKTLEHNFALVALDARFLALLSSDFVFDLSKFVISVQPHSPIHRIPSRFSLLDKIPRKIRNLHDLVDASDNDCKDALRMDRVAFARLCDLLQTIWGLRNSKYVCVQEKVAMFLSILAHHTNNRSLKFQFKRSGHTVSKYFHSVLQCVCKLHSLFLIEPNPVAEENTDPR
ncbi:hypothetical protein ACS0TY_029284 [Phlomoides rotata]